MAFCSDKTINTDVPEKDVFALHFLQTLSNLRTQNPIDSPDKANDRVRKIKTAAYVSMAKAAGGNTKRLWIKALLRRAAKDNKKIKIVRFSKRSRKRVTTRKRRRAPVVEKLRNLVPGGGKMDTAKLMEETAHYIKCLSMQVKVMQCLVDGMSPK